MIKYPIHYRSLQGTNGVPTNIQTDFPKKKAEKAERRMKDLAMINHIRVVCFYPFCNFSMSKEAARENS